MTVSDIEAAHSKLAQRAVEVSEVQHLSWRALVFFNDPDANKWFRVADPGP